MLKDIKELNLRETQDLLKEWHYPRFHAGQIFSWIYQKGGVDFDEMSNLPAALRERLKENFRLFDLKQLKVFESVDGTKKFLFALDNGSLVEAVAIPAQGRLTGCISTQIGCKFACAFCASGMAGFKGNLTCGQILDEVLYLKADSKDYRLTHLVFMGSGEPLDNYDNVMKAIRIINSPEGLNIAARRITVSTCGLIPGIERMAGERRLCAQERGEGLQIELSVSLHAPDDKTRTKLMPLNKKYPLKDLIRSCYAYVAKTNRQITFEYVLIKDVNCNVDKAKELARLLKGLNCKVNLIVYNPVGELPFESPGKLEVLFFRDALIKSGINCIIRKSRGRDIDAACGQLRLKLQKSK